MRHDVLFDENTDQVYSPGFVVAPGVVAVIRAWGFTKAKKNPNPGEPKSNIAMAEIEQLYFGEIGQPGMDQCHGDISDLIPSIDIGTVFAETVTQGGLWSISACNNLVVISVPGAYRLVLNDPGHLGQVKINMVRYSKDDVGYLPNNIQLGA